MDEKYDNGHNKITTHSFRAYFITKVSRHDPNFAKKLAGQKRYLLQYDRMSDDEKIEKYLEVESDLFIFDESKKNAEIRKMATENNSKISELESKLEKITHKMDLLTKTKEVD